MFDWLGQRFGKAPRKARQPQPGESSDDLGVPENAQQRPSSDSLRSLLKMAIADAEQIAASVKTRAQQEAEAEAARIIAQARLEVQEIRGRAEIEAQKQAEEILSAAKRKAEIVEVEVKHKALQYLLGMGEEVEKEISEEYKRVYSRLSSSLQDLMNEGQNIEAELKSKANRLLESKGFELKEYEAMLLGTSEAVMPPIVEALAPVETEPEPAIKEKVEKPIRPQKGAKEAEKQAKKEAKLATKEETLEEKVEVAVQPPEEVIKEKVVEPIRLEEEVTEEKVVEPIRLEEEVIKEKVEEAAPLKLDSQAIYTGEVELTVASPVELKLVSKLYSYLQTVPELKILYTRGSWDRGTTITVVLEKPVPLIRLLSEIPGVKVIPELLGKGSLARGKSSLPLRGGEQVVGGIKLTLKEA